MLKTIRRAGLLLITAWVAAALTGRAKRRYATYAPEDTVDVAGRPLSVQHIAATYQPRMFLRSSTPSPKLLWVWYEAVPSPDGLDLIYHHAWENEVHPNPLIHALYSVFRAAYYAIPLYDIEYFQISIDRTSGAIAAMQCETSGSDDFFQWKPRHITARWTRIPGGRYSVVHETSKGGEIERATSARIVLDGRRVRIGAETWNHLTRVLQSEDSTFDRPVEAPLRYLTDRTYRRYKFARRSQGDLPRMR